MKKVWSTLLLAGLLILTGLLSAAMAEEYSFVGENDAYALYADEVTGCFFVQHRETGLQWWSNPPQRSEDRIAKGMQKMDLNSVLLFRLFDIPVRNETLANTQTGSVSKDSAVFSSIPGGFRMDYTLPNFKMTVPMEVILKEDYVEVSVLVDQIIEENPEALLAGVSIVPFFHAGGSDETGYMLVPDGSGALIYLNNKKQNLGEYKQRVYGRDLASNMSFSGNVEQPANLPVFGMHKETSGYLAVVTEGDAYVTVNARVSGVKSSYNTVFADFTLRTSDDYEIGAQNQIRMFDKVMPVAEKLTVRFYMLPGIESDYNAMAQQYREYLLSEGGLAQKESDISLFLECYGAVDKQQSFIGFPYMKEIALTRFTDAIDLLNETQAAGIRRTALVFREMTKASVSGTYQSGFEPSGILGGKQDYQALSDYCKANGVLFAPAIDSLTFSRNTLKANSYFTATKTLPQQVATLYTYRLGTGRINYDRTASCLIRPAKLPQLTGELTDALADYQPDAIALTELGRLLFSDFNDPHTSRSQTEEYLMESARMLDEAVPSLVFAAPNAYVLPYADMIYDVPQSSSRYDLCDVSIPFCQLCLNGIVPYASTSINLSSNPHQDFLLAIENGSIPKYTLIEADASILIDTELDSLLGVSRSDWQEELIAAALEWQALREKTGGVIVRHEIVTENVRRVVYESGAIVYVNFGDTAHSLSAAQSVPACGYLLMEEETP